METIATILSLILSTSVGGLVVSAGDPPTDTIDGYHDFNANMVMLWEAEEAAAWAPWPAVVWVAETGQIDDPVGRQVVPFRTPPANVFGFQVGDEPQQTVPDLSIAPGLRWTNFSYWAPGVENPEPVLDEMLTGYEGDLISVSEYNLTPVRLHVLAYFREQALELGIPYWQYLNAYAGWETGFEPSHAFSDLAWSAFTGQAFGYTGHIWFAYNIAPEGHQEATQGGGSIFHGLGSWDRTEAYGDAALINAALLRFGETLHDGPVDWVSTSIETTPDLVRGQFGPWAEMIVNNHHTYTGDTQTVTVDIPERMQVLRMDGTVTDGGSIDIPAGGAVVVTDPILATLAG